MSREKYFRFQMLEHKFLGLRKLNACGMFWFAEQVPPIPNQNQKATSTI